MKNPYLILGLPLGKKSLSDQQVKSAYLRLVQQYSPDRYPEQFQVIRGAYEQLENNKKRLQYALFDTTLADRDDFVAVLLPDETNDSHKMQRPDLVTIQRLLKERK